MTITSVNTFAGIGGWNVAEKYLGIRTLLAANHSAASLKTNKLNFPDTTQVNLDIMECDEEWIPGADIKTSSPECTHHTNASGEKRRENSSLLEYIGWTDRSDDPFAEQSRETMRGVHRWAEIKHRQGKPFKMIFVENVTDIRLWSGLKSWYRSMEDLGYNHSTISFNSRFARPFPKAVPQNRDRTYIIFWLKDLPAPDMDIQPLGFCDRCETEVKCVQCWISKNKPYGDYGTQYVYHCPGCNKEIVPYFTPVKDVLDLSLPTPKIGERARPLCQNTLEKIEKGLKWYARQSHQSDEIKAFQFTYNKNPVFRTLNDVAGTCTGKHRHALITLPDGWNGGPVAVEDCGYRMFTWQEYKDIMGLPDWFQFDCSQAEIIRQIGLSVTPAAAVEILGRGIKSLVSVEDSGFEVVSA